MRRLSIVFAASFFGAALAASCTQDFGVFETTQATSSGSSSAAGTGGSGGMASGPTSSASASSAGGGAVTSSASSSASSSAVSSSASSSASASTTGTGQPEDCTNGVDDDGDGDIDCADSDCTTGFVCVPSAPAAWNGPAELFDGDPASLPANCPSEHPMQGFSGFRDLMPTPAICSACACADPQVTCTPAQLELDDAQCATMKGTATQPPPGGCGPVSPPAGTLAYKAAAPSGFTGACAPSGGTATLPPANWGGAGLACAGGGQGSGCNGGVCSAKPSAGFAPGLCVWRGGDHSCPGGFGDKHLYVSNVIDTRGCSACSCGGGTAVCSATTTVFGDGACAASLVDVPNDGSCVGGAAGGSIKITVMKSGSCPVGGGQPVGNLVEGNATTTVCCVP